MLLPNQHTTILLNDQLCAFQSKMHTQICMPSCPQKTVSTNDHHMLYNYIYKRPRNKASNLSAAGHNKLYF